MTGTGNDPQTSAPAPAPSPSPAGPGAPAQSPPPPPGSGAAPGGGPPPEQSRQEQMGISDEVISVLGYDPFGPPPEPAPPQPTPTGQPPAAPPGQVPPVQQPAVQPPSELETLRQHVQQLEQRLTQPAAPAPQPGAPGAPQPIDPIPTYQYEIPDQVLQMLSSEDPSHRKVALGNVMTAVSRSVHGLMQKELAQVIPMLARQVVQEHLAQQEVGKEFYTKYPTLDKPELRPLIYQIASSWAQQNPNAGWNAQTRDAIARVVHATFNMPFPGQGNGQASPPPPPQAPTMMPTMSRPAATLSAGSDEQELMDMLR